MALMMRSGRLEADPWRLVFGEDPVPETGDAALPAARLERDFERPSGRKGVVIAPSDGLEAIAPFLGRLDLAAIVFPGFRDGRGYTHARLLRARYGFEGEIRAIGDVLIDQMFFMGRVGFDSFDIKPADLEPARAALRRFSIVYQEAADDLAPAWAQRHLRCDHV